MQNAGGVGTYVPLTMLVLIALAVYWRHGSATQFTWHNMMPHVDLDTVNFWSQIAFAFTGLELVSAMSEEIRDPRRTLPRAVFGAGAMIAFMYVVGTFAILALVPAADLDPKSGVFHALTVGSTLLKVGILGVIAAMLVTVGNAGGVGSTVAGIARVPFVVGIDRYLPAAFGKIHPKWKTPYISILVQAGLSGAVLLISQINQSTRDSYQQLIDAAIILYFIPFLYMFLAAIKLSYRKNRASDPRAVLIPGGIPGVWIASGIAFCVTLLSIGFSVYPPGDASDRLKFQLRLSGLGDRRTEHWPVAILARRAHKARRKISRA